MFLDKFKHPSIFMGDARIFYFRIKFYSFFYCDNVLSQFIICNKYKFYSMIIFKQRKI